MSKSATIRPTSITRCPSVPALDSDRMKSSLPSARFQTPTFRRWDLGFGVWDFLFLLRDRTDVIHDVPDVLILQLILPRHHVEVRRDAVLDAVEDLAVGRAMIPFVIDEARRRGN